MSGITGRRGSRFGEALVYVRIRRVSCKVGVKGAKKNDTPNPTTLLVSHVHFICVTSEDFTRQWGKCLSRKVLLTEHISKSVFIKVCNSEMLQF